MRMIMSIKEELDKMSEEEKVKLLTEFVENMEKPGLSSGKRFSDEPDFRDTIILENSNEV